MAVTVSVVAFYVGYDHRPPGEAPWRSDQFIHVQINSIQIVLLCETASRMRSAALSSNGRLPLHSCTVEMDWNPPDDRQTKLRCRRRRMPMRMAAWRPEDSR